MSQYIRKCTLIAGSRTGKGLDFSDFRVVFLIKKSDAQTPNSATIKVYGVDASTAQQVTSEFTGVVLQAGYQDNFGVIFQGTIKFSTYARENGVDTVLTMYAADGDVAYNTAIINKTLSAGATQNVIINEASATLSGVSVGSIPNLNSDKLPRGKTMFGMSRDVLRNVSNTTQTTWSIQDESLQFIKLSGYLPGEAVVLNSSTGLIGSAEQTTEGMKVRCLINPFLRIGGLVKLNNSEISRAAPTDQDSKEKNAAINLDGVYRIYTVGFDGDSQGQNWYADLLCLGVDQSAPESKKVKNK